MKATEVRGTPRSRTNRRRSFFTIPASPASQRTSTPGGTARDRTSSAPGTSRTATVRRPAGSASTIALIAGTAVSSPARKRVPSAGGAHPTPPARLRAGRADGVGAQVRTTVVGQRAVLGVPAGTVGEQVTDRGTVAGQHELDPL